MYAAKAVVKTCLTTAHPARLHWATPFQRMLLELTATQWRLLLRSSFSCMAHVSKAVPPCPGIPQVTVHVSGVQCPSMSKRPPGASTSVAAADSGTPAVTATSNGEAAAPAAPTVPVSAPPAAQPEPFAREAKWFSEQRALNREVGPALDTHATAYCWGLRPRHTL